MVAHSAVSYPGIASRYALRCLNGVFPSLLYQPEVGQADVNRGGYLVLGENTDNAIHHVLAAQAMSEASERAGP